MGARNIVVECMKDRRGIVYQLGPTKLGCKLFDSLNRFVGFPPSGKVYLVPRGRVYTRMYRLTGAIGLPTFRATLEATSPVATLKLSTVHGRGRCLARVH